MRLFKQTDLFQFRHHIPNGRRTPAGGARKPGRYAVRTDGLSRD